MRPLFVIQDFTLPHPPNMAETAPAPDPVPAPAADPAPVAPPAQPSRPSAPAAPMAPAPVTASRVKTASRAQLKQRRNARAAAARSARNVRIMKKSVWPVIKNLAMAAGVGVAVYYVVGQHSGRLQRFFLPSPPVVTVAPPQEAAPSAKSLPKTPGPSTSAGRGRDYSSSFTPQGLLSAPPSHGRLW